MKLLSEPPRKQETDPFMELRRELRTVFWLTATTLVLTFLLFVRVMFLSAPFP
ncbi:hypothetical protein G6N76_02120 [Rhizobium daejeonense]|uniref:Uncharacterized protein n=1 Tax=Rhizobium daejeonense TaxID=240521 RepID=A0A6M1RU71_9HYPH|nr:hypothetical protein [Rhizobium daejeonense]NGO62455.1 hypothetical protein [Rhizobium daejeonense]